jgi:iron(III) transport system permease protein
MRVHQQHRWHGWWRVEAPLEVAGWIAAAALVLALSAGELGASLLVAPPGSATLTMRLYNYLHSGASRSVAGTCLTMWLLAIAAGLVAFGSLRAGTRRARSPEP